MKKLKILLFLVFMFNTACITRSLNQKGNIFDNNDISNIKAGLTNKDNVVKIIGYPTNQSYFNNNIWIYYSYQIKEVMFFKPSIEKQKVLVLNFNDETDIVEDVFLYDINSNDYEILDTIDKIDQNKDNIIQDIFRNIGQISM